MNLQTLKLDKVSVCKKDFRIVTTKLLYSKQIFDFYFYTNSTNNQPRLKNLL